MCNIKMRTLEDVLNKELSPDNMDKYTPNELAKYLVENKIVNSVIDFNKIVIEAIQKALREDDEFPIRYYRKGEDVRNTYCDNPESLTDEYIDNNLR